jgi:probable rRNA maturation factor
MLEVTVLNRQRQHPIACDALARFLRTMVRAYPPDRGESLALLLVSDRRMQALNRAYRGRPGTTDVLSFPAAPTPDGCHHLGDLVICVAAAARQAPRGRGGLARELRLLALHGYLHLLGYDHHGDGGVMMRLQHRLARQLRCATPSQGDA